MGEYPSERRTLPNLNPHCRGIVLQGKYTFFSKETIGRLAVDFAVYLLDLPIDPDSLEVPGTEHHRIEERRIKSARSEELAVWGERILNAQNLNEVFL
uniref:Uncharacterized protein n=1 Tax=Candidatus Kentrum sp. FW TaxID=2126338 RepID=A0A450TF60_9GAMM|nr:MAG: hypothetical protein BECKFW1821C_GA0114237_100840 [Candidatus Kentron sp. FW]